MKIGIFGGTFDPVHYGHIELCRQAQKEMKLDKLFVVPAKLQPFKLDQQVADGFHRLEMLCLAFQEDPEIEISAIEFTRGDVSYTIHTLKDFRERFPEGDIYFILGIDAFMKIELWKDYQELLKDFKLLVGVRPGYREEELESLIVRLEGTFGAHIHLLSNKRLEISSTELKQKIKNGLPLNKWIPPNVERYIKSNALYT